MHEYTKCEYLTTVLYDEDNDVSLVSALDDGVNKVYVLDTDSNVTVYEFLDEEDYDEHEDTVVGTAQSVHEFMSLVSTLIGGGGSV